jgi:predicted DNA-binding protein (MmcQ/YjbR family)
MPRASRRHPQETSVCALALAYPETHEDFPWGHRAIKVRGKVFVFMSKDEPALSVSVKLPWSSEGALQLSNCEPTHYGLGKSGWVTATFGRKEKASLAMLRSWIDESYRAVAPKQLAAQLEGSGAAAKPERRGGQQRRPSPTVSARSARSWPRARRKA